ncbi:Lipopolysaccharide biosynthesis protein wzxC [Serratia liquefaciens]|nr:MULTISPECIES: lipopolysaccharide biosynthesis protein [Serratia]MCS4316276.1 O-antigen/teichoic acid export membrane protein [Serratia sp. BIGb0234]OKP25244.1 lipopolysaccharide biosynthesis protein [Serratia liquefaciens]CAI2420218.1 Lipopolysaccharide biosynthesis protein wzxC [Serratia liquefaciens]CAI2459328.1 Lipopolysaccharide biosynthesis protein wzxC [Serratia liquefaciens]CAI2459589.1 Lipopolysaccharide biosynthesis protein wzxC [Serratia liquefaciens]
MSHTLKERAVSGMIWSIIERFLVQGVQFGISIVLARIISPSDFGLIGMVAVFIVLSDIIINSGFTQALIQKKDRTQTDYSTVFYFNLLISILLYAVIYFIAPLVADFYSAPPLVHIIRVLGISIIIKSLCLVQTTKLAIDLNFKLRTKINFLSVIISGSIALYLANHDYGAMALVYQTLINSICVTIFMAILLRWRPNFEFSFDSLSRLFGFGSKLLLASFVRTIVDNCYAILIGRFFSSKEVGYYTQGRNIPDLISVNLFNILQGVLFPILSSTQDDTERLIRIYKKSLDMTAFIVMPAMVGFTFLAEPFVHFFLTDKWLPAVVVIQWICLSRMIIPISALNCSLINAVGRSDTYLKVDLSKLPITVGALLITAPFGLTAVVVGNFIVSLICFFINAYYPGKWYGHGAWQQIKSMLPMMAATLIMSAALWFIRIDNGIYEIMVKVAVGAIVYYLASMLLKIESCYEVNKIILSKIKKKKA